MTPPDHDPPPAGRAALWERSSLAARPALARAAGAAAVALVVAALVGLVGGPAWALSVALGGGVVLAVLWGSARVLTAGARRVAPAVALLLALGLYLLVVVGLFVLAVAGRPADGDDGPLQPAGVGTGVLVVVLVWTAALLVVHVRHDRGPRRGSTRS